MPQDETDEERLGPLSCSPHLGGLHAQADEEHSRSQNAAVVYLRSTPNIQKSS